VLVLFATANYNIFNVSGLARNTPKIEDAIMSTEKLALISTVLKIKSIPANIIKFNGCNNDFGWHCFQECEFDEFEVTQEIEVFYGFGGYAEESCGGYEIWEIKFVFLDIEYGNSVETEFDMLKIIGILNA